MITIIGIIGTALILLAFFLNQVHVWKSDSFIYEFTNLVGAGVLTAYALLLKSWPFIILNVVWALVALYEIINMARGHKPKKKEKGRIGHKKK